MVLGIPVSIFHLAAIEDVLAFVLGLPVLYLLFLLPSTFVAYWVGKLLWMRLEWVDRKCGYPEFKSDVLKRVLSEVMDLQTAKESRELSRYEVVSNRFDESHHDAQFWPYDYFWQGFFWRPLRQYLHILKWLRMEWLAFRIGQGLRKKKKFEDQAMERLEGYHAQREERLGEKQYQKALGDAQEAIEINLKRYQNEVLEVRVDAEDEFFEVQQKRFEEKEGKQKLQFERETQEQEDRLLEDEVQQRQNIAKMITEKEKVLEDLRHQLEQASQNRELAKDERMQRIWELLEEK